MEQAATAQRIGQLLAAKGWEANVGSHGDLVPIMMESGIPCHAHVAKMREDVDYGCLASVTGCNQLASELIPSLPTTNEDTEKMLAWGIRLGLWMSTSDAFLFIGGAEGTLAHLVPVLAWNRKALAKEGRAKKIVVIGWTRERIQALQMLGICSPSDTWLSFHSNEESVVEFLTS